MSRPKFRITVDSLMHAAQYLEGRLGSLRLTPRMMTVQEARHFITGILISRSSASNADRLQVWCDENLDAKSQSALQTAIRKRRQRASSDFRVVTLSSKSYRLLSQLAKRDNVTLSQALQSSVERSLKSKSKC